MRAIYVLKGCRGVTPPLLVGMVDGRGLSAGAFRCPACCPAIAWKLMRLLNMSNADIFWPPQFIIAACTHTHSRSANCRPHTQKRPQSGCHTSPGLYNRVYRYYRRSTKQIA